MYRFGFFSWNRSVSYFYTFHFREIEANDLFHFFDFPNFLVKSISRTLLFHDFFLIKSRSIFFVKTTHLWILRIYGFFKHFYRLNFQFILRFPELENTEIMTQYSLCSVVFQRHGPYLSLDVPGLAEKRPSLALGDVAIVRQFNRQEAFEGKINRKSQIFF